jgi:CBS domain-containing protein
MSKSKSVRDLMVDVFEFPHIPHWFTIRQAMGVMRKSFVESEKCIYPQVVLVFDEKYNIMGTFTAREIIKGLEPKLMQVKIKDADIVVVDENAIINFEARMFSEEVKKNAEKPVSEMMTSVKAFVAPDDSAVKAAIMMVHYNLTVLPVLENKQKLVGVVRMLEAFEEISNIVLE